MAQEIFTTALITSSLLKAYYRFSDNFLTLDSTSKGHTLTAISDPAEDASGKFGYAVALDGDDAYSIADHADLKPTGSFTIGGWIKATTPASGCIFQSYSMNTNHAGFRLDLSALGKLQLLSGKNTGTTAGVDYQLVLSTTVVMDNTWHFCVGTWDGVHLKVYVDGTQEGGDVDWANAPAYAATNYVRVGCRNASGADGPFVTGSLDDVFLINGMALTSAEISSLWAGTYSVSMSRAGFTNFQNPGIV